jgi:hypothetical protein
MAVMTVHEMGEARRYDQWQSAVDHVDFRQPISVSPDNPIEGALHLDGDFEYGGHYASSRLLVGSFNARYDPRPEPAIREMSAALLTRVLRSALQDFSKTWVQHKFHVTPGDSSFDVVKAKAYIRNRFSDVLVIDSLSTNYNAFYVRLRGRSMPIVCTMMTGAIEPSCEDNRSLKDRILGHKTGDE